MGAPIKLQPRLPADLAITERSRAFYDGRYKWDSDGFTDEHGVYRGFDCYVPEARAPTPLPPMFSDDDEDGAQEEGVIEEQAQTLETDRAIMSMEVEVLEPDTPCPKRNSIAVSTLRAPEETQLSIALSVDNRERNTLMPQEKLSEASQIELITDYQDESTVASTLESMLTVSKHADTEASLHEGHKLSGPSSPEKEDAGKLSMPDTPPETPAKSAVVAQTASPASTTSTLSPVPSNLSDQDKDMAIEIKGAPLASRTTASPSNTASERSVQTKIKAKAKATTRGVARKVIKGSRKTSGSKSNTSKRKDDSIEDFTLLELHSGEFLRKSGRRKSARQAQSGGD